MKDLTNFYDKKSVYEEIYGKEYSKNLKKDIKKLKKIKNGYAYFLIPVIVPIIYLAIAIPFNIPFSSMLFCCLYLISINTITALRCSHQAAREKRASLENIKDLSKELLRNDVEVSLKDLENGVISTDKKKNKVVYRDLNTNKKVVNHKSVTEENNLIFLDREEQVKCLKEIRELIKEGRKKEEIVNLYLLDEHEIDEKQLEKVKILNSKNK